VKVGDIVRLKKGSTNIGVTVDIIQKKCWRTSKLGPMIDWRKIDAETHAVILFPHNEGTVEIPVIDLEVV
tara:strand:+ start:325 stop:534 length:210 start_codon:yes stop_codon:yes gene_type:complete